MTLPTVGIPTYEVKLPSTGQDIRVRPFLVRQEKMLLMAAESKDDMEIVNTTKQVIKECMVDETINIDRLPFFDIDYLFIALRAKSIGEKVSTRFFCQREDDNGVVCGGTMNVDIDIAKATVNKQDIPDTIALGGSLSIKMKYPTYSIMRLISDRDNVMDRKIKVVANCIDQIIEGKKISSAKDHTKEELIKFVEGMTNEQFQKLEYFVDNFPTFSVKLNTVCPKCGFEHNIDYKDFTSFFQ